MVEGEECVGLILNEAHTWLGVIPSRHWLAVKRLPTVPGDCAWFDLDSRNELPTEVSPPALIARLERLLNSKGGQVLVVRQAVTESTVCASSIG